MSGIGKREKGPIPKPPKREGNGRFLVINDLVQLLITKLRRLGRCELGLVAKDFISHS